MVSNIGQKTLRFFRYIFLVICTFIFIFPVLWMGLAAFKPIGQIYDNSKLIFFDWNIKNWILAIQADNLLLYLRNSFFFTIVSTIIVIILASFSGYALAKLKMKTGTRKNLSFWFLSMRFLPPLAVLIPIFILYKKTGLLYQPIGLILAYVAFNLPLAIWLMEGFFYDVPKELIEASQIDGSSSFNTFLRIALPLSTPGLISATILTYIFIWNEFIFATILTSESSRTLPVWASFVTMSHFRVDWTLLGVVTITMTIPVVIFSVLIQKYIVRGLTLGAIKG
jgi:multiple sugar transport system permease protein